MNFIDLLEIRLINGNINKALERESVQQYPLNNSYYKCEETVEAKELGIQMGEPLRWLLVNLGIDPLNIELNEENGTAILYHEQGRIFRVNYNKGNNEKPYSIYKDYFFDFNTLEEIYSSY